jgi:hypothetical protein
MTEKVADDKKIAHMTVNPFKSSMHTRNTVQKNIVVRAFHIPPYYFYHIRNIVKL